MERIFPDRKYMIFCLFGRIGLCYTLVAYDSTYIKENQQVLIRNWRKHLLSPFAIFSPINFIDIQMTTPPDTIHPLNRKAWRQWLAKHHDNHQSVWLVFFKSKTGQRGLSWSEAVEEALCFGWIDSKAKPLDEDRYMQFFSRRKPKSVWSRINKEKVEQLIADGLMTEAGMKSITLAKENGSWSSLDEVEDLVIPKDLAKAFRQHRGSKAFFNGLSKSVKKMMLHWIASAKRPETRQKRIDEIATHASQGKRANGF
jgi:uncharacterized protein YdeI (YjbR/CyaY-like superfamily)